MLILAAGVAGVVWQWRRAEAESTAHRLALADALLAQARAQRVGGEAGRRFQALKAIRKAASIRPCRELRDEAIASLTLVDLGPEEIVTTNGGLCFSPDLKLYATQGPKPGMVDIVRVNDHQPVRRLEGGDSVVSFCAWSLCGRYLGIHYDTEVHVWEIATGKSLLQTRLGPKTSRPFFETVFSADGRLVLMPDGESLLLRELPSGKELKRFPPQPWYGAGAFHPHKPWLALIRGTEVDVWDFAADRVRKTFASDTNNAQHILFHLAWSPDGNLLAGASANACLYLWRTSGGATPKLVFEGSRLEAKFVAFNHAGDKLVSWHFGGDTRLWDAFTGKELVRTYQGQSTAFGPDDQRLAFRRPGGVLGFWPLANSVPVYRTLSLPVSFPYVDNDIAFSPDRHWLASVVDHSGGLRIWDLFRSQVATNRSLQGLRQVFFLPDGRNVVTTGTDGVRVWPLRMTTNAENASCEIGEPRIIELPPNARPDCYSSLSRDGRKLLLEDLGERVLLLDLAEPSHWVQFPEKPGRKTVALSPDGRRAAIGWTDAHVEDTETGARLKEFDGHQGSFAFSADGRWLVLATKSDFQVMDAATLQLKKVFPREMFREEAGHAAFSADGKYFAYLRAPQLIELVDATTLQPLATLTMPEGFQPWRFRFSPDGCMLGAFGDGTLHIWDLPALRQELAQMSLDW